MSAEAWAIIICFRPRKVELTRLLAALKDQVPMTLIMNNGGIQPEVMEVLRGMDNVRIVELGENLGIAKALNCAFDLLQAENVEFGVTFDQDSQPSPDHVATLVRSWRTLNSQPAMNGHVGAIGPSFHDKRDGHFVYPFFRAHGLRVKRIYEHSEEKLPRVDALITSGMLLPLKVWRDFRFIDELFIDYVDTEWCFRTKRAGYQHYGCFEVKMQHELSEGKPIVIAGMILLRYSALRRYYYFRNGAYLAARPYVPAAFRIRLVAGMIIRAVTSPFIDKEPMDSIRHIFHGLKDAARSRFGRLDV